MGLGIGLGAKSTKSWFNGFDGFETRFGSRIQTLGSNLAFYRKPRDPQNLGLMGLGTDLVLRPRPDILSGMNI